MNLEEHLRRAIAFSRATYGPGARTKGVIDHIRKELKEIEEASDTFDRAKEWTDIVILGLDGLWRELHYNESASVMWSELPYIVVQHIEGKQDKNEQRDWPDWRTASQDKAIEHDRGGEHD